MQCAGHMVQMGGHHWFASAVQSDKPARKSSAADQLNTSPAPSSSVLERELTALISLILASGLVFSRQSVVTKGVISHNVPRVAPITISNQ